jgi:hypothetical protein
MSEDKLSIGIYAINKCANCFVAFGARDNVDDDFEASEWYALAKSVHVDQVVQVLSDAIYKHINDSDRHITAEERIAWNDKANASDVATASTDYTFGVATLYLYKIGKMVCAYFVIPSSDSARQLSSGTMPAGYLPVRDISNTFFSFLSGPGSSGALTQEYPLQISVRTTGNITIRFANGSTGNTIGPYTSVRGSFTYVTA